MQTQRIGRYDVIRTLPGDPPSYLAHAPGAGPSLLRRLGPVEAHAMERSIKEVALVATLGHAAIAHAEAFADGDHLVFAVPEREGVTLADLLDRLDQRGDTLPLAAAMHVASALASALAATHSSSLDDDPVTMIGHGFLSPSWVWLGWAGEVALDGLGLAPIAQVKGLRVDPVYDAPEQRAGGKPTPRGDIYSLAALVWALVMGEPPPDAPSAEALGDRIPDSLRAVLARALEPALGKRKIVAAELEAEFRAAVTAEGPKALTAALVALRKGTNVLGTLRAPGAPPIAGGLSPLASRPPTPAPLKTTLPAGGGLAPRPGVGALPPRPVGAPRPAGTPAPGAVAAAPAGAPLGARLPPPRARLGSTGDATPPPPPGKPAVASPPTPAVPETKESSASLPPPPTPAPPPLDLAPPPPPVAAAVTEPEDIPAPPPSIRPRLPSVSFEHRPAKPAFPIQDELSWDGNETVDMAAAVDAALDAALLGDLAPAGTAPSRPMAAVERLETQPSHASDPPPPSVDSSRSGDLAPTSSRSGDLAPTSSRGGFGLDGGLVDLPLPASTPAPVPPPPPSQGPASGASVRSPESAPEQPLSLGKALALGLGAALVVFAAGGFWLMRSKKLPPPPTPADVEATVASASATASSDAAPSALVPATDPSVSATADATAAPTADATAAPSGEATAAPTADASAAPSASAAAAPAVDTSTLAPNQALLLVHFAANPAADVFFFARSLGKVEQPLTVPCDKSLFLRVGTQAKPTDPPLWLSDGRPYPITCQKLNEVTIASKP